MRGKTEMNMDKPTIKLYIEYLRRYTRNTNESLWDAHQNAISREVAREYGVTEEELLWLNENL